MEKPFIFITNDDGVGAKGLNTIIDVARKFAKVIVIAPERGQSGMSHAVTLAQPLFLRTVEKSDDVEIYACSGTPVDCVKMGYDYLFKDKCPILNISGINHGSNSAISVLYSGTMGAALECSFYGAPAIGLSITDHSEDADFDATVICAEKVISDILRTEVKELMCLNINVPMGRPEEIKGMRFCRQTRGFWQEEFSRNVNPMGKEYFWLAGALNNEEPEAEDTDEWALKNGYISIVPIKVDITNYEQLNSLSTIIDTTK